MLDIMYTQPAVIARHQNAPRLAERERFLDHCAVQGYSPRALQKIAWLLLIVVNSTSTGNRQVSRDEIRQMARQDQISFKRRTINKTGKRAEHTQKILEKVAIDWFNFLGELGPCDSSSSQIDTCVDAFVRYMREQRGLSEVTIETRRLRISLCLQSIFATVQSIEHVEVLHIDNYLHLKSDEGWCRSSLFALASDLRSFFRFAEAQCWCRSGLTALIEAPRLYRDERLPQSMAWEEVEALIESLSGDDPVSIRDRAIILLLAYYGFRRGEVARLQLEHIDWQAETLKITRPKQRRFQSYPLIQPVGDALIRYLREVRPQCHHREVFLAIKAPLRPLSAESITPMVRWRSAAVSKNSVAISPHKLRHACAQHLLTEGFSLKQIGDQLGHRSASTTAIYTKIDLKQLRQVAEIDLGKLL